jgi:spore coat polysaccharide biosynthesis predicted glycosyltransferase SpsG
MRVLEVLANIPGSFQIIAVLGPSYVGKAELASRFDQRVRTLRNVSDMAKVLGSADIAVSGGGNTASELAFLGVPMILLPLSNDQYSVANGMEKSGAAVCLGFHDKTANKVIAEALANLIGDVKRREEMIVAGRLQVDGNGANRITKAILSTLSKVDFKPLNLV